MTKDYYTPKAIEYFHGSSMAVIELWPHKSECIACDVNIYGCKQSIPMYLGEPVSHDRQGEWGGFDACHECFAAYTAAQADETKLRQWWNSIRQRRPQNEKYQARR